MQASREVRPAEMLAGVVWLVLLGATVIGAGYLAYTLTGRWNFFLRVLARGAILMVGFPLLMLLSSGLAKLWEDVWESDREPVGSGWLAKTIAGLCVVFAAMAAFAQDFAASSIVSEVVRCLTFGSVALLASPSIEGEWRRRVATVLTFLVAVGVIANTFVFLGEDAPGFWVALLAAFATPVLGYGLQLAVASWLCRWTRGRLEARAAARPAPRVDPAA